MIIEFVYLKKKNSLPKLFPPLPHTTPIHLYTHFISPLFYTCKCFVFEFLFSLFYISHPHFLILLYLDKMFFNGFYDVLQSGK